MAIKIGRFNISLALVIFNFIFLIFNSIETQARISTKITSSKGLLITNPVAGQLFNLDIVVHDGKDLRGFNVDNINKFKIKDIKQYSHQSIINGIRSNSLTFSYSLLAEKEGNYIIGPIVVESDGKVISAEPFNITVKPKSESEELDSSVSADAFVKVEVDNKNKFFVGQKIPIKIRFYFNSEDINFEGLSQLQAQDFVLGSYTEAQEGFENVKGKPFKYLQWTYDIFATKAGKLKIEPMIAAYSVINNDDIMSLTLRMMGAGAQRKMTESESLYIDINKIPEYKEKTGKFDGAIGNFTDFEITTSSVEFSKGAPFILNLSLKGEGNFEYIKWPELDLPDSFRVTQSKVYGESTKSPSSRDKITFEYIVQGLDAGEFNLNPQKLVFFDPIQEKFKTLETNSLRCKIIKSNIIDNYKDDLDKFLEENIETRNQDNYKYNILRFFSIPYFIFLLIFLIINIFFIGYILILFYINNSTKIWDFIYYKLAFKSAEFELKKLEKSDNIENIYDVFEQLLYRRNKQDSNYIRFKEKKALFEEFYLKILTAKFYNKNLNSLEKNKLFEESKYWVKELSKILEN